MKKLIFYLVVITLLCTHFQSTSQIYNPKNPHFIRFDFGDEISYRELPYKIDQVIDSTNANGIYGFVIKGFNSTLRPVQFENGLEYEFKSFLENFSFYNPLGKNIVMVVDELNVSKAHDLGAKKKPGVITLSMKYYSENKLYYQESITKTHKKGSKENSIYAKTIQSALEQSLNNLEEFVLKEKNNKTN